MNTYVASITAQNQFLSDMSVTYEIRTSGDSDSFNITDNKLYMTVTPDKPSYSVTIESSASGEFGTDNHRLYTIMVSGPSADAGDPQTVTEGDTVTLDGTRSRDTRGGVSLTYLWEQTSGPPVTLSNAAMAGPTFTAPKVGEDTDITFTLTVMDTGSLADKDTVIITVNDAPNTAPDVDAGVNQNVTEGDTVLLSGTASDKDPEDTVLTYEWTHNTTLTIDLQNATALSTSFTAPDVSANTTVLFTLNVSDGAAHATDAVMIAIADTNTPPSADAGYPRTVTEGDTVTLDGRRSNDPEDGNSLSYLWAQTSGPRVTLIGPSTATPTFTAPNVAGDTDITFTLTVTDSGSFTDTDNVTITVQDTLGGFLTTWETTSANDTITIPVGGSTATYLIDWGDGTIENVSGDQTHTYADAGFYTIRISGDFERIYLAGGSSANAAKLKSIDQWGSINWGSMAGAFQHATEMTYVATDTPDLSGVTDMSAMFLNVRSFYGDISSWDVSRVTDMSGMFLNAQLFDGDISSWDVSRVTNMSGMFENTYFNQDISNWNVSQVMDMSGMFRMNGAFDQPLNWDVSQVTNMSHMFEGTPFNQDISNWNVSRVTDMSYMFSNVFPFDQNIANWDVSRVTDMSGMFENTYFNQDISNWNVSRVTDMSYMFSNVFPFDQNIANWDVSRVTNMSGMFANTYFNQDISNWNVSRVTDMSHMFDGAFSFDQNLGNWYITLDSTVINAYDAPGAVASIMAQNQFLSDTSVTYEIRTSGDYNSFNITDNKLYMTVTPDKPSYSVTIESSASGEFGTDNHRAYAITVSGINNQGAPAGIRPDRAVYNPPSGDLPATLTLSFDGPTNGTIRTGHLSIRDALSDSAITLAGAPAAVHDLSQIYGGPPTSLIYEVRLGPEAAALVEGAAEPVLDMDSGAVYGPAGSPSEPLLGYPIAVPDVTPPAVRSVTFDPAASWLVITFTEAINHDLTDRTGMTMRGSLANLTLPDAGGRPSPADALAVPLNRTHLDTLGGAPTHLDIAAGAVSDAAGNPIITATIQVTTPDTVPPEVTSATYHDGTGRLAITFSEPLDHAATDYALLSLAGPSANLTLAHIDRSAAAGGTIEVRLNATHLETLGGTPSAVSVRMAAVYDAAGNPVRPATIRIDVANPANRPPVVDAGPNLTIPEGDTATLSGMVTDPDGDALAYLWSHDPATLNITLANRTALSTTLTAPQVDTNTTATLTLTASDGTASVSDTLTLTITDIPSDAPYPATAFVTTWQTSTDGESITIPVGGATGTYTIDWGDGTASADVTGDQTHTYDAAGTYAVGISGDFARIYLNGDANAAKLQSIDQWGGVQWESMEFAFRGASSMAYRAADSPDLSGVSSMRYMFQDATSFNGDISSWDVSSVTNMIGTFQGAASFNQDLSTWDVSSANDMRYMFRNATSFNGDLSTWDVSSAVDLTRMFQGAASFNQDLSSWDVSSVTGTAGMFYEAASFNQDLSTWDVSSVTNMVDMFRGASSFNQDLSTWDVSSVASTAGMFYEASSFNQDLSTWDVSHADDMDSMFHGADSFDQNLGEWYIVLDDTTLQSDDPTGAVGNITAQNPFLDGHNSTYGIGSDGDSGAFEVDGATLILRDIPAKRSYTVTVTSAGGFGSDNSRTFEITILNFNHPPTASAGDDRAIPEGDTVTLNATASDPDTGDTLTYLWTSDRPGLPMSNSDTLAPSFTAPQVDTDTAITLTLSVTDQHNATATDQVTITVTDVPANATLAADTRDVQHANFTTAIPNNPPTASAGDDQIIPEGDTVTITGTASDPDTGDTLTYLWTSDRPGLPVSDSDTLAPSFTAPQVDTDTAIILTLSVTDSHNATATDQVTITVTDVPPPNTAPTASAGDDQTIPEGDTVTITGTASDPDTGDTLTYLWTSDRPGLPVSDSDTLAPSFTAPQVDTDTAIILTLSVTDSHNATATDQVTITVTDVPPPNTAPTASAGDDQTIPEGDTVTITGTASDPDTGDTLTYLWTSDRPGLPVSDSDTLAPSFTAPQVDTDTAIILTLSVTDSHNATATDQVTITVTDVPPPNTAPTASAGDDQTIPEGDTVTITGTASDPDTGDTLTYLWTSDRPGLPMSNSDTLAPSFTAPQVDTDTAIILTLSVTDSHNATATDQVTITVTDVPPPNTAPTASAGDDQTIPEGDTVTITGTASDPDTGDTLTYLWTSDRPGLPMSNSDTLAPSFTAPQVDTDTAIILTLSVTDSHNATATDQVTITVTDVPPPNTAPTASAGDDQTIPEGDTVTITGTASDPDTGDTLTYRWSHDSSLPITLANPAALSTTFTAPQVNSTSTVVLTLTVSDGITSSSDSLSVTITNTTPASNSNAASDEES